MWISWIAWVWISWVNMGLGCGSYEAGCGFMQRKQKMPVIMQSLRYSIFPLRVDMEVELGESFVWEL